MTRVLAAVLRTSRRRSRQPARAASERSTLGGVLELRVHGVNNTAPAAILDLPEDAIERVVGDDLASFWREKPGAQDRLRKGDRGWRPPELTREAYSWGGLARNSPSVPGGGVLSGVGRALARLGWALLLPFGIANAAYWTRRLHTGGAAPDPTTGRGAGSSRLFGLALTALTIITACEIALDLVATQCYRGQVARCGRLPDVFDVLAGRETPIRLVIAAAVPLALLMVLYLLSSVTRSYYERATCEPYAARGAATTPREVLLSTPGFWSGEAMVGRLVRLHLCVGVSVVTLALSWPGTFGGGDACRSPRAVVDLGGACWNQVYASDEGVRGWLVTTSLVALLAIVRAAVSVVRRSSDAPDVPAGPDRPDRTPVLLAIAVGDLLVTAMLLGFGKPSVDDSGPLLGVSAAPTLALLVLTALAIAGLTWRLDRLAGLWAPLLVVLLLGGALTRWSLLLAAVVLVALLVRFLAGAGSRPAEKRRHVAWRGAGPGILMGLSVSVILALSSLITLVAGDWLNGTYPASALVRSAAAEVGPGNPPSDPYLRVPSPYVLSGAATLITLLLLVALVCAVLLRTSFGPAPAPANAGSLAASRQGSADRVSERLETSLAKKRRFASRAHRAEKVTGCLACLGLISVTVVLALSIGGWPGDRLLETGWQGLARKVIDLGTVGLAAVGAVVLAALVGGKSASSSRPLGLIWDLVCFLPRAAHPFGPPCYAERAVPEIVGRCAWWLEDDLTGDARRARRGDRIVLSAHSLGSVLAVAALLALPRRFRDPAGGPISLLTYGSQLRAYFGRIFPELIGPQVLGTAPSRSALLWSQDPWQRDRDEPVPAPEPGRGSVVSLLGGTATSPPRWRNLWRRTDYLGFPVNGYVGAGNHVDQPAEEVDKTGYLDEIVTHSEYQRAPAYAEALTELARQRTTSDQGDIS